MKNVRVSRYSGVIPPGPGFCSGEERSGIYTRYFGVEVVAKTDTQVIAYAVAYDLDGPGDTSPPSLDDLLKAIRKLDPDF